MRLKSSVPTLLVLASALSTAMLISACGSGPAQPAPVAGAPAPQVPISTLPGGGTISGFRYTMSSTPQISWQVATPLGQVVSQSFRLQLSLAQYGAGTGETITLLVSQNGGAQYPIVTPGTGPVIYPVINQPYPAYRYRYRCRGGFCAYAYVDNYNGVVTNTGNAPCLNNGAGNLNYNLSMGNSLYSYSVQIESGFGAALYNQSVIARTYVVGDQQITQFDLNLTLGAGKTLSQAQIMGLGGGFNPALNPAFPAGYNPALGAGQIPGQLPGQFPGYNPALNPNLNPSVNPTLAGGAWISTTSCSSNVGGLCTFGSFR